MNEEPSEYERKFSLKQYGRNIADIVRDLRPSDLKDTPGIFAVMGAAFGAFGGAIMGIPAPGEIPLKKLDMPAAQAAGDEAGLRIAQELGVAGLTKEALDKIIAGRMEAITKTVQAQDEAYTAKLSEHSDIGTWALAGAGIGAGGLLTVALLLSALPGGWVVRNKKPAEAKTR